VGALFLSTFVNRIDKKGRVSVPANFRAALAGQPFNGVVAYPSFINSCIEASGMERVRKLSERIESLDPFSEERDVFATAILGGSFELAFDGEGRVMLPSELIETVKITDTAMFVGKGETFEIWEPATFKAHAAEARRIALEKRLSLRAGGGQ
jgi:MraZ protein